MSPGDGECPLLEQCLEEFLDRLLTMKAGLVRTRWTGCYQIFCGPEIALGFSDPGSRQFFHRALCPCSRSLAETSRLLPAASLGSPGCEQSSPGETDGRSFVLCEPPG